MNWVPYIQAAVAAIFIGLFFLGFVWAVERLLDYLDRRDE